MVAPNIRTPAERLRRAILGLADTREVTVALLRHSAELQVAAPATKPDEAGANRAVDVDKPRATITNGAGIWRRLPDSSVTLQSPRAGIK